MNKIGNIIFYEPLVNHKKVDYINYIDCKNGHNDLNIDTSLPILFVGWNHFKNQFHTLIEKDGEVVRAFENVSILNKELSSNSHYWEFSFNEQKSQHITGIDMFVHNLPTYFFECRYTYQLIDPVKEKLFSEFNIINWYNSKTGGIKTDGIYTYKDNMTYILNDDIIYGIDHNTWDFFGMENAAQTFITSSQTSPPENIFTDKEGDTFANFNKIFSGYTNLKRYLVVLLSK